jgi:hypothetical protein
MEAVIWMYNQSTRYAREIYVSWNIKTKIEVLNKYDLFIFIFMTSSFLSFVFSYTSGKTY